MPTEKRQRQDEGRLNRRIQETTAARRTQRNRTVRNLGIFLVVLLGGAFIWSVVAGGDDDDPVDTAGVTSTVPADETSSTLADRDPAIGNTPCPPPDGAAEKTQTFESGPQACIDVTKTYTAVISTNKGDITVELDPASAPKTVNNFVFLARNRYYEDVIFHRIIKGFMIQGGDPTGTGSGGPGYEFVSELPSGPPYYEVGSIAMANSGADTNGSQFFIVVGDAGVNLSGDYSRFGKVSAGMDTVHAIEAVGMDADPGTPSEEIKITKVTITEQ
jgi:cyclophilin family peptidyl-prolyl cis-trans isomerase